MTFKPSKWVRGLSATETCNLAGDGIRAAEKVLTWWGVAAGEPWAKRRAAGLDPCPLTVTALGEVRPWYEVTPAAGKRATPKRRRRQGVKRVRPLTARQAEIMQIVGECKGNLSEAARQLGIHRNTLKEQYEAANKKLGVRALTKPKTHKMPEDNRGQDNLAADADRRRL